MLERGTGVGKGLVSVGPDDCKVVRSAPSSAEIAGLQGWNCGFPPSRERRVGADSTGWKDFAIVVPPQGLFILASPCHPPLFCHSEQSEGS